MNFDSIKPTEIDSLLPSPQIPPTQGRSYKRHRRTHLVCGAGFTLFILIAFVVHSKTNYEHHQINQRTYRPKVQAELLNALTQTFFHFNLDTFKPSNLLPQSDVGEEDTLMRGKGYQNHNEDRLYDSKVFHCTSTLMIMRHCDKGVTKIINGKAKEVDSEDIFGDRHCNAEGKARSKYIASLFVDPKDYQDLVHEIGVSSKIEGPPAVPMVSSSRADKTNTGNKPASKKPQFPAPVKLYALNDSRQRHKNFREVETITPLSKKFHLDIDERFGVKEEGDLAIDYFKSLSKSVIYNFQKMIDPENSHADHDSDVNDLCHNGLTVVNWKHSRIPLLAHALGCGRDEGCPKKYQSNDFDTVWMVTYQYFMQLDHHVDLHGPSIYALKSYPINQGSFLRSHNQGKMLSGFEGRWKIKAQLVNEGFDPVKI